MNSIKLTRKELFYVDDAVQKHYWLCRSIGEDSNVLKIIMGASNKINKLKRMADKGEPQTLEVKDE